MNDGTDGEKRPGRRLRSADDFKLGSRTRPPAFLVSLGGLAKGGGGKSGQRDPPGGLKGWG